AALDRVVPRALGDVRDDETTPFGDGRAIAEARAMLHAAIAEARDEGRLPSAKHTAPPPVRPGAVHPGLAALRADLALRDLVGAARRPWPSSPAETVMASVAV